MQIKYIKKMRRLSGNHCQINTIQKLKNSNGLILIQLENSEILKNDDTNFNKRKVSPLRKKY